MSNIMQQNWYKTLTRVVTACAAVLYLVNVFLKSDVLSTVIAGLCIIIYALGFMIMNKTNRIVVAVLLAVGIFCLVYYQVPFAGWRSAILKNIATIGLIFFSPILANPFFYKPYQAELKNICLKYVSSPFMFLLIVSFISAFLGFFMAVACLPVLYALLSDISKEYKCHRMFVATICAGSAMTTLCGPTTGASVVLPATGISFTQLVTVGGPITIVLISVGAFINYLESKKDGATVIEKKSDTVVNWSDVGMLAFLFVLLITILLLIDNFTNLSVVAAVSLLAVPFAVIFALIQKKTDVLSKRMNNYFNGGMLKNPNTMTILGIGGFAGEGLKRAEFIKTIFSVFTSNTSLYLLFPLIIITIAVVTAVVGVHPSAMGTTLSNLLTPEMLSTSWVGVAMIILCGWSISLIVSPFSAVTNLAASTSGLDVWSFTAKKQLKWAVATIVCGSILIDIVTILGI